MQAHQQGDPLLDAHTGGPDKPHPLQPIRAVMYEAALEATVTGSYQVISHEHIQLVMVRMAEAFGLEPPRWGGDD